MDDRRFASDLPPEHLADRLKERVYVTFTALATTIVLLSHASEIGAGEAASTLLIVVVGTLSAVFLADFISHLAVHGVLPDRHQLRDMVNVTSSAFGAIVLPLVFLLLAALDLISVGSALGATTVVLLLTLVVVGYLAVRRVSLPPWQKLIVLTGELVLGLIVVTLELLAHG